MLVGDGRETIHGDGESCMTHRDDCIKVFKLPDGRLFGGSRGSEAITRLQHALINNHPPPKLDDINGLLIDLRGKLWIYEGNIWQKVEAKYYAIGSGSVFATAAMDAGASAIKAVRIGIKRDPYSGGKITTVRL